MKKIKFSHKDYHKFFHKLPWDVTLLQCFKIHYKDLSKDFIEYDTEYEGGRYELPETDLIVLILLSYDGKCLTTIRRFTPRKWKYYKSLEGKDVEMVWSK